jgi:serine protease Do
VSKLRQVDRSQLYHIAIFLSAALILLIGGLWRGGTSDQHPPQETEVTALEVLRREVSGLQSALTSDELQVIEQRITNLTRATSPLVMSITPLQADQPVRRITTYGLPSEPPMPLTPDFNLTPALSGLLLDRDGYIATSATVLRFGNVFTVGVGPQRSTADLISVNENDYTALLKLREALPETVSPAFDPSTPLVAGEWLIRQGRAASGDETRSLVFLESTRRTSSGSSIGLLNTQANPQADGASLINDTGRIVGIYVTAPDADAVVVPLNRLLAMRTALTQRPAVVMQSWPGFEAQDLTPEMQEYFEVSGGVLVARITEGSPAAAAGLRALDIIEKIDEAVVTNAQTAMNTLAAQPPATRFMLSVRRNSRAMAIALVTGSLPSAPASSNSSIDSGLVLELTSGAGGGVSISGIEPSAVANSTGLTEGDIIRSVNRTAVLSVNHFLALQRQVSEAEPQLWQVERGNRTFFVALKGRAAVR